MAVSMEQSFARELREWGSIRITLQEFAEQERLAAEGLGALVAREEIDEFVAEDRDTGRLKSDHGDARFDLGLELVEDFEQQALCAIEHTEVVEWASAAEVGARDEDVESGGFEDFDCGAGRRGEEVVVEGVGPEKNARAPDAFFGGVHWGFARAGVLSGRTRACVPPRVRPEEPLFEGFGGESGNAALWGNSAYDFCNVAEEGELRG